MFGIGAELGLLGVLAFSLSNRTAPIRGIALAVVIVPAMSVAWYAIAATAALADSAPGSALPPDSSTSATSDTGSQARRSCLGPCIKAG